MKHLLQIKESLKIGGVSTTAGYWKALKEGKKVVEIDLVIDRADYCANLCEIKFRNIEFIITKTYAKELARKKALFQEYTKGKKALFTTLITPYGAKENAHYFEAVDNQLNLAALFQ